MVKEPDFKTFLCDCHDMSHHLFIEKDDDCIYVTLKNNTYLPFLQRLKVGFNYIFGRHHKTYEYDCVILDNKKVKDLIDWLTEPNS